MTLAAFWRKASKSSGPLRALCLLLVAAFLLGGGARGDVQSLIVLRPLAILLLAYGLAGLRRRHLAGNWFVAAMAVAIMALLALHLVPLPPAWWSQLPGRSLVAEIDAAAGLGPVWRPLSLAPDGTRNALYAVFVPLAALVLGLRLDTRERQWLIRPLLLLGGASALLGLAQSLGGPGGPLQFYRVTNPGAAVGLFANRNHQALLLACLLPMLAVWASTVGSHGRKAPGRRLVAGLAGGALLPLLLITGSRAGLILSAIATLLIPAIVLPRAKQRPAVPVRSAQAQTLLRGGGILAGLGLVALTVWLGRGMAWERLRDLAPGSEMRVLILPALWAMIRAYLPLGSGLGSFEQVYRIHEPDVLLDPTYTNHAHNDWLEVLVTGGLPAMGLLLAAAVACLVRLRRLFASGVSATPEALTARLGAAIVLLAGLASLGDYPLRTPSISCLFVVAVCWMNCALPKNRPSGAAL